MKNLIIISHRRSGTHLTIDTIINNFPIFNSNFLTLEHIKIKNKDEEINKIKNQIKTSPNIIKTHMISDYKNYFNNDKQSIDFVEDLISKSKIIYVYRDGKEVLISLYRYMKSYNKDIQKMSFSDFIRMDNDFDNLNTMNRVEYWKNHVQEWINTKDILCIDFREFTNNKKEVVKKISNYLNMEPPKEIISVYQTGDKINENELMGKFFSKIKRYYLKKIKKINISSVNLSGKKKYHDYFNDKDLEFFNKYS